jgi:hypothetical protein
MMHARRGRPRIEREEYDYGTPELRARHMRGLTAEPIDRYLSQSIITQQQHWCALHFRWLYTLRFGVPTIQALDPNHVSGMRHKIMHWEWQQEREQEWRSVQEQLANRKLYIILLNIVVFNRDLLGLHCGRKDKTRQLQDRLLDALSVLEEAWCG